MFDFQNFKARFDAATEESEMAAHELGLREIISVAGDAASIVSIANVLLSSMGAKKKNEPESEASAKPADATKEAADLINLVAK